MRWSPPSPLDSVRLPPVDVAAIRIRLHMTQRQFAKRRNETLTAEPLTLAQVLERLDPGDPPPRRSTASRRRPGSP